MTRTHLTLIAALTLAWSSLAGAQKTTQVHPGQAGSPHVRSSWVVDGANITIEYGRPYLKGRPEAKMMPAGQPWRIGADEQTTLKTDRPLKFGSLSVPAGAYGLWAMPGANEWQLIVSKRASGWGVPYPEGQDLGRVPMKVTKNSKPVEQLTIGIDDTPSGAALNIEWGTVKAGVPFTVG